MGNGIVRGGAAARGAGKKGGLVARFEKRIFYEDFVFWVGFFLIGQGLSVEGYKGRLGFSWWLWKLGLVYKVLWGYWFMKSFVANYLYIKIKYMEYIGERILTSGKYASGF